MSSVTPPPFVQNTAVLSSGTVALATLTAWVVPAGFYNIAVSNNKVSIQLFVDGAWSGLVNYNEGGFFSDGVNVRVYNTDTFSRNFYYQKFI